MEGIWTFSDVLKYLKDIYRCMSCYHQNGCWIICSIWNVVCATAQNADAFALVHLLCHLPSHSFHSHPPSVINIHRRMSHSVCVCQTQQRVDYLYYTPTVPHNLYNQNPRNEMNDLTWAYWLCCYTKTNYRMLGKWLTLCTQSPIYSPWSFIALFFVLISGDTLCVFHWKMRSYRCHIFFFFFYSML